MRAGLLIYGSLDTVSGGYLYDRMLVRALHAAGHSVEIVSLPWRSYPAHLADNLRPSLARTLASLDIDVLLQDELNHPSLAWTNGRIMPRVRYPIAALVHHLRSSEQHPASLRPLYRTVERRYLRTVAAAAYNSRTTQAAVAALLGGPPPPGPVAFPAADHIAPPPAAEVLALAAARARRPGPLRLLFVGNVIPRKGLHTLVQAVAAAPPAACTLTAVGSLASDRGYVRRLRAQIARLGVGERVRLAGSLPAPALRAALAEHHLFAAPSYEGFGIVYLEAMAFGLPAIASTAGAAHEIITEGANGHLVSPDAPGAVDRIAQIVVKLHENRVLLSEMSAAARARYDAHPTWDQSMAALVGWLAALTRR